MAFGISWPKSDLEDAKVDSWQQGVAEKLAQFEERTKALLTPPPAPESAPEPVMFDRQSFMPWLEGAASNAGQSVQQAAQTASSWLPDRASLMPWVETPAASSAPAAATTSAAGAPSVPDPDLPNLPGMRGPVQGPVEAIPGAQAQASPAGTGEIETYIRQAAAKRGINPDVAVRVALSEGGLNDPVRQSDYVYRGRREQSYGPLQLNVEGGVGSAALRAGIDPRNPAHWRQAVDFGLDEAARSGWGQWHGAARVGIGDWEGIRSGQAAPVPTAGAGAPPAPAASPPSPVGAGNNPTGASAMWSPDQPTSGPAAAQMSAGRSGGGVMSRLPLNLQSTAEPMPEDATNINPMVGDPTIRNIVPYDPATGETGDSGERQNPRWTAGASDIQYRQPLSDQTKASDLSYDSRDADQGPRETSQSAQPYDPDQGPREAPPASEPESPFKPIYDLGGRIIGYVQAADQAIRSALPGGSQTQREDVSRRLEESLSDVPKPEEILAPIDTLTGAPAGTAMQAAQDVSGVLGPDEAVQAARRVAPVVRRGAESVAEGARGLGTRVAEGLAANAERTAAADTRMAAEGSTRLPGTLGVISDNPLEAGRAARTRVIPPDVADTLDFPVRVPDDPAVIRAIEAVGGTVNPEKGVTLNVTRAQSPAGAGGVATRGGVFYEAVPEGGKSTYSQYPDNPKGVGGSQVIPPTPTRFRSPLILDAAPGEPSGFDGGMRQMGATRPVDAADIDKAQGDLSTALGIRDQAWADDARARLTQYYEPDAKIPITDKEISDALREARATGPEGSPARAQALKDLVSRYGGDPSVIDDLIRIRGADASESAWAIKENILAANARRAGYDGVVTVQQKVPSPEEIAAMPAIVEAKAAVKQTTDELNALYARQREWMATPGPKNSPPPSRAELDAANVRVAQAQATLQDALDDAKMNPAHLQGRITELADVREARNPTPGAPNPKLEEARAAHQAALDHLYNLERSSDPNDPFPGPNTPEMAAWWERRHAALKAARDEATRTYQTSLNEPPHVGEPGYTLREDIPRRPETRASTIVENPRRAAIEREYQDAVAEHGRFYEQYMREAPGTPFAQWAAFSGNQAALDAEDRLTKATYAYDRLGMSNEPKFMTAQATAGISARSPAGLGARILTDVSNAIGGGIGGATIGGGLPADTPEERRRNALLGAGVGMVAGPAAGRLMRRGEGALATPGVGPNAGPRRFANPADALQAAQQAIGTPNPRGPTAGLDRMESVRRWIVRNLTDNRVDLAEMQKEAQRLLGRPLKADEMLEDLTRANPSGTAKVMIDDAIRPALQAVGDDRKDLGTLMRLLNNGDVAAATGNPGRLFSGGLTGADSQAAAAHLWSTLSPEQQKALDASSDALYRVVDHYRDAMVDAGVWTPQLAAELKTKYPNWVPTKILDYMNDPATVSSGSKSISLRDRGLRAYTIDGTAKAAEDPIASLVRYVQDAESIIQKNEAFNAFVNLRDRVPGWDQFIKEVPSNTAPARALGEKTVTGFVNGERKTFVVPAPMAAAIQMEQGQQVPILRQATQLFKEFITRTPMFVAGQIPLDAFSYGVRETAREGGVLAAPKVAAELARGYAEAFKGLLDGSFKGDAARYLKEGGGMAGFYERSADAASKTVDDLTRRNMFEVRNAADARKLTGWMLGGGWVQAFGGRVEMAPRIASFRLGEQRALKVGASKEAAALQGMTAGRDVTLDFQRGGTAAKVINQIVPFFNVGVQSAVTLPRIIRENPTGAATTLLSLVAAPTIAAEAWNRQDPQRSADYDDVPDYIKDRGIVIMLPGVEGKDERGERRPNYALVPMRELAPVAILARSLAQRAIGKSQRDWTDEAKAMLGAASPIQANSAADLFSSFNPVGLNTGLQLAANKDFFRGGDITTDRRDEAASAAAHGLASATGYRPSQTDFAIRDLFGGTGAMASAASDLATGKTKDEQRIQNTPLAGGLISRFVGDAVGGNLQRAQMAMLTPAIRRAARDAGLRDDQITPVQSDIRDMPITRQEQAQYQRDVTRLLDEGAREALADPEWRTMSQAERERWLRNIATAARREAGGGVIDTWDDATLEQRADKKAAKKAGAP